MTLFKRHIGRRVAGIGVGVALLVLGLEAPAFAVAPTIATISPNSGPASCVVVIKGTNFNTPAVTDVDFTPVATADAIFQIVSDTEIWTTVPADAANGPIRVTNPTGFVDSPGFTVADPGGCAPKVDSFTPTCGAAGTVVTITGTNLLKNSGGTAAGGPPPNAVGGDVAFAPYAGDATHTGAAENPTTLTVTVPASAADGPIRVSTFSATTGRAFSTTNFDVNTACVPAVVEHARSITLSLRKHLVARGKVSVGDGFTDCAAAVPVKIQRRRAGGWRTVGSTTTTDTGAYNKRIKDTPGKYRAKATQVTLNVGADICLGATSPARRHTH